MRYLFLVLAVPAAVAAQEPRPITLPEAVRLAQLNSATTVSARNAIDRSEVAVRTAWGAFLPTVSASAGASHQGGRTFFQGQLVPYSGNPWSFNRGLSSNLRLFDAGQRYFQLQAARSNVTSAEASERQQNYRVALDVATQYYAVLAARENRAAAQSQLEQAEADLRAANARVAAGAATKSDSLRSVITVGNAQLAILTAENSLQDANAALSRLVATPYIVTATPEDSLRVESFGIDSVELTRAIESAPTVVSAQSSLTAARASLRAARTPYLPTLSMNFNMSGNNTSDRFDWGQGQFSQSKSLGFSLSYPLFNGFQREQTVANATLAERDAIAELRDAMLLAQQQLIQYIGNLHLATERIKIQQASLDAAEEDVRVQRQRYALGATTLLDLLTSQSALNSARFALIQARRDARIAKANIEALLGRQVP